MEEGFIFKGKCGNVKKLVGIGLLIFIILSSWGISYGSGETRITGIIGFGGKVKLKSVNPLKITVSTGNSGIDEGIIRIETENRKYYEPVKIDDNSEKVYYFSIPIPDSEGKIKVTLENKGKKINSVEIPFEPISEKTTVLGILSDEPERLNYLSQLKLNFIPMEDIEIVDLTKYLSLNEEELENLDMVFIENYNSEQLPEEFGQNLIQWVKRGHNIFIGNKTYKYKTLTGIFKNLNQEEVWHLGEGNVVSVNENLETISLDNIKESIEKYAAYLNLKDLIKPENIFNRENEWKNMFFIGNSLLKPSYNLVYIFLSLLIVYLIFLIIGLGEKRGKIFGISIGAFSLIFLIAFFRENIYGSNVGKVEIKEYGEGVFSTGVAYVKGTKENSEFQLNDGFLDGYGEDNIHVMPLSQKVLALKKEVYPIFFQNRDEKESYVQKLSIDENSIVSGEIQNILPYDLDNSFIIIGDTVINIGTLNGKQKLDIKYRLDENLKNTGDFNYLDKVSTAVKLDDEEKQLFEQYYYAGANPKNCYLIGFSTIKDKDEKTYTMNVFQIDFEEKEHLNIPFGVIRPVKNYTKYSEDKYIREYTLEEGEELLLYYPVPVRADIESLNLRAKIDYGSLKIEALNQKDKKWEELSSQLFQSDRVKNFTENGPLTIKITGKGRIMLPQISLRGKLKSGENNE